jgi:hypothetical protein
LLPCLLAPSGGSSCDPQQLRQKAFQVTSRYPRPFSFTHPLPPTRTHTNTALFFCVCVGDRTLELQTSICVPIIIIVLRFLWRCPLLLRSTFFWIKHTHIHTSKCSSSNCSPFFFSTNRFSLFSSAPLFGSAGFLFVASCHYGSGSSALHVYFFFRCPTSLLIFISTKHTKEKDSQISSLAR